MNSTNIFKPILFNTEMVKAILAGRKTQTRIIAPFDKFCTKPFQTGNGKWQENYNNNPDPKKEFPGGWNAITNYKSKYQIGDILWVRETFQKLESASHKEVDFLYKADVEYHNYFNSDLVVWTPSIHMPKEAARIFLKVTNVRCERLQDISEEDAIAEGIEKYGPFGEFKGDPHPSVGMMRFRAYSKAARAFQDLWDSINAKKYPWKSNPWVWVYDFERIEKPENFI